MTPEIKVQGPRGEKIDQLVRDIFAAIAADQYTPNEIYCAFASAKTSYLLAQVGSHGDLLKEIMRPRQRKTEKKQGTKVAIE